MAHIGIYEGRMLLIIGKYAISTDLNGTLNKKGTAKGN